jgi:dTDP-4-amino-4,6-dideoxygalactose transaminase
VVTNVFGLWRDFEAYIAFARTSGKAMLIDNAAGIDQQVPDWPYQAFSLHHTKPYGIGEGGFLLSPRDEAETIYQLLNYGKVDGANRSQWLNNGKLSDIACAYHLDRLAQHGDWAPRYREQATRIAKIAVNAGLRPLIPTEGVPLATSHAYLAPQPVPLERLQQSRRLTFGKYYKPLSADATARGIFDCLVNIPTHPDIASLSDEELGREIENHVFPGADHQA